MKSRIFSSGYWILKWSTERNKKGRHPGISIVLSFLIRPLISHSQICIRLKEFAHLTSQRKTRVRKIGFIVQVIEIADVWWRSIATTHCKGQTKYTCELHIRTLAFLIVLTIKQYVNTKTIRGRRLLPASHDFRGLDPSSLLKFFRIYGLF